MCYCDTGIEFALCCEPYLSGNKKPATPEALMRSRFSAYATGRSQYIYDTYAESKKTENPLSEIAAFASQSQFIRLDVLHFETQGENGLVEFKAHYLIGDHYCLLHEQSRFCIEAGEWRYLDGTLFPSADVKLGRNDPCPCHSDKKFKKCHGR